ncbi:MAG: DegT/DnrJ/EryC1/StrS family aminotransferase [Gemmatimonadota bacterium]
MPLSDPVREYRELAHEIDSAVLEVLRSGRYVLGDTVAEFEASFADRVGVRFAVGVASGTDALRLALEAVGVGPGDEVITTPFTFPATATAIMATGATPVFADVRPGCFTIDPDAVAAAVTQRTAALVPVHLFGQMADMEPLVDVADSCGLAIVEDAAQAFGADQRAPDGAVTRAGGVGNAGAFSFYPTKSLGAAGDGGIVTTDDRAVADRLVRLRNHGRTAEGGHAEPGHNSRLDAIQAAFLTTKLPRVDEWTERRRAHAGVYEGALAEASGIRPPAIVGGNRHIFHQYTVLCHGRARVAAAFDAADVDTSVFYDPPIHRMEAFASLGVRRGSLPVAEELATRVLSVPVFAHLSAEERDRVAAVLTAAGSLEPA